MLFRVSSFDICHIYRMEKEQVYMTVGEPESSVILKYIWGTASEQEKGEVDLWLKKHPESTITNSPYLLCLPDTRTDCFSGSFEGVLES